MIRFALMISAALACSALTLSALPAESEAAKLKGILKKPSSNTKPVQTRQGNSAAPKVGRKQHVANVLARERHAAAREKRANDFATVLDKGISVWLKRQGVPFNQRPRLVTPPRVEKKTGTGKTVRFAQMKTVYTVSRWIEK